MVLAHALLRYTDIEVVLLHVDHAVQPQTDEVLEKIHSRFQQLNLRPYETANITLNPTLSSEDALRTLRWNFLLEQANQHSCPLLTAHHLNDQAETVLLRMLAGSGPRSLAGIPKKIYKKDVLVLRPLLDVPKQILEQYSDTFGGLEVFSDPTNFTTKYSRGHLRSLMPVLEQVVPETQQSLARTATLCSEATDIIDDALSVFFPQLCTPYEQGYLFKANKQLSEATNKAVLHHLLKQFSSRMVSKSDVDNVYKLIQSSGTHLDMPGYTVTRKKKTLLINPT